MELYELTVKQAADKLNKGEISARELTESCCSRIQYAEDKIGALVTECTERCLAQADEIDRKRKHGEKLGKLAGIPGIVKDCISTRGVLSTASSNMLSNYIPVFDAHVVENLKNEDFLLIGKANMDEFAMGSSTENSALICTNNPWDLSRVPGGSSGGSAASVAADEAMFALGSDTGGSIRQPAGFCGVVGLKPTYGTVSRYGLMSFASSLDQIGPVTKTVEDSAIIMNIISGVDERDSTSARMDYPDYTSGINNDIKGIKIGVPIEFLNQKIDEEVRKVFESTLVKLKDLGAEIIDVSIPSFDYALSAYYIISSAEVASNLARYDGIRYGVRADNYSNLREMYVKTRTEGFGDEVKRRVMLGNYVLSSGYYDAYYLKALKVRTLINNDFKKQFEKVDALVSPVSASTAFRHYSKSSPLDMYLSDLFTVPANIAGLTAISIPAGLSGDGLPIAFQIISDAFCEKKMFNIANKLEYAIDFKYKPSFRK